ncbi:hypothetical protein AAG570_011008 [Ranatra chinensis]|uniref:Midasin AAA lid domain-containing protein n=1 Tax=Ranatra chinensis TaxID=642074 RepID=A0ABD0YJM9_9HEMI
MSILVNFFLGTAPISSNQGFYFDAPTTCLNALRILRSLQIPTRAVLLEGSPGVGKTSLVTALAKASGNQLNLASQSVVEGLNSVLDHRGEIFIPELGKTFYVKNDATKIFACQNPQRQGGARKGLPQSFLNRFTQVFMEILTKDDLRLILSSLYPRISPVVVEKMVEFNIKLTETHFISGTHWEWNLRDLSYWAETIQNNDPGTFAISIYAGRMRNKEDKHKVIELYENIFGPEYPLAKRTSPLMITPTTVTLGHVILSRTANEDPDSDQGIVSSVIDKKSELLVLRCQLASLCSLSLCVKKKWMAILVGSSHSGKSSLVHLLAQLTGRKLFTLSVNSAMDTTELLGGFEQVGEPFFIDYFVGHQHE